MTRSRDVSQVTENGGVAISPAVAGKNFVINGNFDFWQRGTSSGSGGFQTADRWYENASNSTTFSQETSTVPTGSKYSFKMTAGSTATMWIQQSIETINTLALAGQTVTVSAQVQASTTVGMTISAYYSTSVDNTTGGSWSNSTTVSGGTGNAVSGSFTKITGTFTIPSTAKTVLFYIATTSTVSSGTSVWVSQCQLELGSVATPFSRAGGTIQGELAACQRYYKKSYNQGTNPGTATYANQVYSSWAAAGNTSDKLSIFSYGTMRTSSPTITLYDGAGNSGKINLEVTAGTTTNNIAPFGIFAAGDSTAIVLYEGGTTCAGISFHYTVDSEL